MIQEEAGPPTAGTGRRLHAGMLSELDGSLDTGENTRGHPPHGAEDRPQARDHRSRGRGAGVGLDLGPVPVGPAQAAAQRFSPAQTMPQSSTRI